MATSQEDIQRLTALNNSGFDYKLPDGTIIKQANGREGATVDVAGILAGRTASPINPQILDYARNQATQMALPTTNVGMTEQQLRDYEASRGGFVQNVGGGTALYGDGTPSPINPNTPQVVGPDYLPNGALTPEAQAKAAADGQAAHQAAQTAAAAQVQVTPQSIQQGAANITNTGATIPTTALQPGSTDTAAVKALQDYLVKEGYMTQAQVDTGYGTYGPQTTAAVLALQKKLGVDYSSGPGYFGPKTIAALQAGNKVVPNTTPNPVTGTGLSDVTSGSNTAIILGGNLPGTPYNPTAVVAGATATSKSIDDYIKMLDGPKTAIDTKYEKLLAEVEGLLPSQGGRGAAQLEAEKAAGVNDLKMRLATVNADILRKTAEYKALTTDIEGKPITMNSIIGAQAQIQRVMASDIGMLQAQALGLQGQVEAAQQAADRAVDLKYADSADALNIRLQQLELIRGELDKEESRRADAITLYLQDQKEKLAAQMATEKELSAFNINAMGQYPSAGILVTDSYATTQKKIVGSKEYQLEIAQQNAALAKASSTGTGSGGSNQMTDNERALMTQFRGEQIVKDYNDILGQKGTIDAYIQNGVGGPADLALVFSFMKGLDPTSVVRESEYETAAKSGNIFQGTFAKFNGYFKEKGGFLPDNVKAEFQNLVNQKLAVKQAQYDNVKTYYEGVADRQGLDPRNVVIDYASGGYTPPTSSNRGRNRYL